MNEKLKLLEELLELDDNTLEISMNLDAVENWDSLNVLAFIAMADEKYNLLLSAESINNAKTVKDLLDLLDD